MTDAERAEIAMPEKSGGVKQYNGVGWRYWLAEPSEVSGRTCAYVSESGNVCCSALLASSIGGAAPMFRIRG
jgi:hypothetical protein